MSPPIPREPGPQQEVDKWGDSLSWSKNSSHSRLATCGQPLLATSHGSFQDYHAACLSPRSPSCELSTGACAGQMGVRQSRAVRTPALTQSLGKGRELGDVYAYKKDPKKQWGPFSAGAGESLSGGARAWLPGHPHISLCLAIGSVGVLGLTQLSGYVSRSPWEPEGLSEEGRKCAQG